MKFHEANRFSKGQKTALVDIDETICFYKDKRVYELAIPIYGNIEKINRLYDEGWHITYWTARGGHTQRDLFNILFYETKKIIQF